VGKRVFLYVQHLLGIGHLRRAATLADAMTRAGLEVTVASGGSPVPEIAINAARVVQLPPATAADTSFKNLVDDAGHPVDDAWKARRRERLLDAWRECDAHALVVELFPFGRRQMRFELIPLLELARKDRQGIDGTGGTGAAGGSRPVIVCSVRDVLGGGRDAARQDAMLELFDRHFDHLLVHGDPEFIPFERTFRQAGRLAGRMHYTGYVVDQVPERRAADAAGRDEVIVSAGGGAVGARLMEMAIRARPLTSLAGRTWRLLAGVNLALPDFEALRSLASRIGEGRVVVERSRPDFTRLLANCALSVSQAGYNTLMEVLQAGARAVVVPFSAGAETEQTLRARLLHERGLLELVEERELAPASLAAGIERTARLPRPMPGVVALDGAARSATLLLGWTEERRW
jgi:predicted glycosyltransferase